jgi:Pyridoxamine 5'-phosphate oxidase
VTTVRQEEVRRVLEQPISQDLLTSANLARIAYTGVDGYPRAVPIGYWWDGVRLCVCTLPKAPKVAALRANPKVALTIDTDTQPPRVLLLRGRARIEIVDGVPEEYLMANRKAGSPQQWEGFEAQVRELYDRMARIWIEPDWAKLLDFETTLPQAVADAVAQKKGN